MRTILVVGGGYAGEDYPLAYDIIIVTAGAVTRKPAVPGATAASRD